ncbi:MAG: helix-turn-helix domain-containing protein [Commensalibacter sp.]
MPSLNSIATCFIPEKVTEARLARQIKTAGALARALSLSVATVTRWEAGKSVPSEENLDHMAQYLQVRPEFFMRKNIIFETPIFLRALKISKTLLGFQQTQMKWLQEISQIIEHYVELPPLKLPDVMSGQNYKQLRNDDIEEIAFELRKYWGLGEGPCPDMIGLLEKNGFIVSSIEMDTDRLDGACSWSSINNRPHILLANDKNTYVRTQMDAAHEMAHAVLHKNVSPEEEQENFKLIESQAFALASAFLLPSTTYPIEAKYPDIPSLRLLKERWKVSIKAQIMRLSTLEIIDSYQKINLFKSYSARGWARQEPYDDVWKPSKPEILANALKLINDEKVRTKQEMLDSEFTINPRDVEILTGLPYMWFEENEAEVIPLKIKITETKKDNKNNCSSKAEVIHWPKKIY